MHANAVIRLIQVNSIMIFKVTTAKILEVATCTVFLRQEWATQAHVQAGGPCNAEHCFSIRQGRTALQ